MNKTIKTILFSAACVWALLAVPAQGAVIMSINPVSQNVTAGSTGNFFDVVLTNTDTESMTVAGFSFLVSTVSSDLVFTSATTAATNYVFAGDSFVNDFNGGDIAAALGSQALLAADITSSGFDVNIGANSVVGLGRVFFSILGGAAPQTITLNIGTGPATGLVSASGLSYTLGSPVGGSVIVDAAATGIPEPGTAALFLLALPAVAYLRKRK